MKTSNRTHEGRDALVTGAGQGIGQAIAVSLAERGAKVIATDLANPDETINKIGPSGSAQLDVPLEDDWRSVADTSKDLGGVDIVVNNAAIFQIVPLMIWILKRDREQSRRILIHIFWA
jgi:NAD(P)-dependent dehydrogenase (short-subunit alcohol dehydrogenase family)